MNHYKQHANSEEQRRDAPKAMDDLPSKKKVDPINEIQVAIVLEECNLCTNFLDTPCLDKLVTKNYREQVEPHDAAGLEVLPSSGEMASEEEVEKEDLSLITTMMIPTSNNDNGKASFEKDSSDQADHRAIIESSSEEEVELSLKTLTGTQKTTTMRLMAWIGEHEISFQVDSGSSYTFVNLNVMKRVGTRESEIKPFDIRVANGKKL